MPSTFSDLVRRPVVVAPMAGGASTTGLITAAAAAGAIGFIAAGYRSAPDMRADIEAVQAATDEPFGVNVFVPGSPADDDRRLAKYLESIGPDGAAPGAAPGAARWGRDAWGAEGG